MAADAEEGAVVAVATETARWDAERQGLVVAFERIAVAGDAAAASFVVDERRRMIVSLERNRAHWDALSSTVIGPEAGGFESFYPSENRPGHWTITAAGLAPEGAERAVIALGGDLRVVPVVDRLYLFVAGLDVEPSLGRLPVTFE